MAEITVTTSLRAVREALANGRATLQRLAGTSEFEAIERALNYADIAADNADRFHARAEQAEAVVKQHEDLLASIALYINWRYVSKQLTTEQKDLFADALERDAIRTHGPGGDEPDPDMARLPSYAPRWWRDEEQPASP